MTVVAPATSLSIHRVLLVLAPLQVGANLQQSDDSFTTYLHSPES